MMRELFEFIDEHRMAACAVALVFFVAGVGAAYVHSTMTSTALPEVTPTAPASGTPIPTLAPTTSPVPSPSLSLSPTPMPSPTVTPDMAITRSITPLDQYAPNYMTHVERSTNMGILGIDLAHSDTGGQYAYRNDTFTASFTLMDISNVPIDRIRIHTSCINGTGSNYTLYDADRIDSVLLGPGDKISRTVGFKVAPDAPEGLYKFRITVSVDLRGNDTWPDFGCSYESGLNILKAPQ